MVAFGGAGGLHAAEVARELHIPTVIIPNYPGQFSAIGMLMADVQHDYVRTYYRSLTQANFDTIADICNELIERGRQTLAGERVPENAMFFQRFLDIRYSGQEFSIPVPMPASFIAQGDAGSIRRAFDELHERRYGYHTPEQSVEIVNVRMRAVGKRGQFRFPAVDVASRGGAAQGSRMIYFESGQASVECPIYNREQLESGYEITGPAVIQEYASTTVLFPGDRASVVPTGELVILLQGGKYNDR
jgi:N-methylhydantoinase A